jgi:hypothetical protein
VRAASIGDNSGRWEDLAVKRQRRWRSDGNQRGGVSGGGSQRDRRVGGGEGGRSSGSDADERSTSKKGSGRRLFKRLGGAG